MFATVLCLMQALVQSAVASPETPISRLGIMSTLEHECVLRAFNAVDVLSSALLHPQQTIHGLLEHWAAATPDAHAVLYEVPHSVKLINGALCSNIVTEYKVSMIICVQHIELKQRNLECRVL